MSRRPLFCDMDGVLVKQTGRDGFDQMPWTGDGRQLWAAIGGLEPTLLTQIPDADFGRIAQQKLAWIDRELGCIPVIFTPDSRRKHPFATKGAILIDDGRKHGEAWIAGGGVFVRHSSAADTIKHLRNLGLL